MLVLGAGMAGLGAARTIADAGRSVIVIEARDRLGGRLWTDRSIMGVPVERGAELIHGADASTWELVREGGIATHEMTKAMSRYTPESPWVDQRTWPFYAFPQGRPTVKDPLPEPDPEETAEQYLRRLGISRDNYPLAFLTVESDSEQLDKAPADEVTQELDDALNAPASGTVPLEDDERDFKVIGGYDQVVDVLAKGLDVRKGREVTAVSYKSSGVEVEAGGERFAGKKLVIALPAGVLQHEKIAFDPPLPDQTLSRITEVVYLPVYKGLLEFAEPVLPDGWDMAETYSSNPATLWNGSAQAPDYSGQVVVAWATGDRARELLALPEADRLAQSLDAVRSLTRDQGLQASATSTYDWATDPFALGAYPGPTSRREGLYEPLADAVFWAGMVTWTISESFDSGHDAGRTVLGTL